MTERTEGARCPTCEAPAKPTNEMFDGVYDDYRGPEWRFDLNAALRERVEGLTDAEVLQVTARLANVWRIYTGNGASERSAKLRAVLLQALSRKAEA